MGAVRLVFGAELRRRWRSWLILVVLIAVVAGVVLAAAAAGRRTATAFPRFVASHGYDVYIFNQNPVSGLSRLPGVSSVTTIGNPASGQPTCACTTRAIKPSNFYINELSPTALRRVVKLVAGQMPAESSPYDVLASFTLQQDYGVHIGSVIHAPLYALSQMSALEQRRQRGAVRAEGCPACRGNRCGRNGVSLRVDTRIRPLHHASLCTCHQPESSARFGLPRSASSRDRQPSPVRRGRRRASPRLCLKSGHRCCGGGGFDPPPGRGLVGARRPGRAGRTCRRRPGARSAERRRERGVPLLGGLGLAEAPPRRARPRRGICWWRSSARPVPSVVAFALSPLTPVGEARLAEPSTGLAFDPLVLLLGALATVVVVLLLGIWPAVRASRVRVGDERACRGAHRRPS